MRTKTKTNKSFAPRATGLGGAVIMSQPLTKMRATMMRATTVLLTTVMLTVTVQTTRAQSVNYIDAAGNAQTCDSYTTLPSSETTWTGWYVASGTVEISTRVTVSGEAHLILSDDATLTIPKGITVTEGNSLAIYGQSGGTGQLTIASPESGYAGSARM